MKEELARREPVADLLPRLGPSRSSVRGAEMLDPDLLNFKSGWTSLSPDFSCLTRNSHESTQPKRCLVRSTARAYMPLALPVYA
jgi:hypothetical protein